jgi:hypothetical protein
VAIILPSPSPRSLFDIFVDNELNALGVGAKTEKTATSTYLFCQPNALCDTRTNPTVFQLFCCGKNFFYGQNLNNLLIHLLL